MRSESRKYLYDIGEACRKLSKFTEDKSLDDYVADEFLRSAVERQFEIIGEALSQLSKSDPEITQAIPDYRRIVAFRNILIHGYATIRHETVWGVVQSDLPALSQHIRALLGI